MERRRERGFPFRRLNSANAMDGKPPLRGWCLGECRADLPSGPFDDRRCAVTTSSNADQRTDTHGDEQAKADARKIEDNGAFRATARLGFATSGLLQLL